MSNPSTAWSRLRAGNRRFCATKPSGSPSADVHAPFAAVFRCADACTPSEALLGQDRGSLIDVSTWGHVIDSGALATMEYAVGTLKTPLIVVVGHKNCAAMDMALTAWKNVSFPDGAARMVVEQAISSLTRVGGSIDTADELAAAHAVSTGASLLHKSPIIAGAVDTGQSAIVCLMSGDGAAPIRACATFGDVSVSDATLLECV